VTTYDCIACDTLVRLGWYRDDVEWLGGSTAASRGAAA
jgi:hypothetical protein